MKRRNFFGAIGAAVAGLWGTRTLPQEVPKAITLKPRPGVFPGMRCLGTIGRVTACTWVPVRVREWDDEQQAYVSTCRVIHADLPAAYDGYPGAFSGKRCLCVFIESERWVLCDIEAPPLMPEWEPCEPGR